jgi:ribonuclease BN (tRNA processing enzyme)
MELAFLGSGAAFSSERYNGAVVVDRRLLLDAGAPLLPHMHRLGIDPAGIDALFLTHYHGDHFLGVPPFILHRALQGEARPLEFIGPPDVEDKMCQLLALSWGENWRQFTARLDLRFREAGTAGEAGGVRYQTAQLKHGDVVCTGYRLAIDGRILAYAGDTEMTPELEDFVRGADIVITEATGPGKVHSHTGWEEALALRDRHPGTRFLFNHLYEGTLDGSVDDLEVVDL